MLFLDARRLISAVSSLKGKNELGHSHCPPGLTLTLFKFLTAIIFICSLFTIGNQYIGDPISCAIQKKYSTIYKKMFEQYCWIEGTHTLKTPPSGTDLYENAYYGVRPSHPSENTPELRESSKQTHNYYQWVPFVLLLQSLASYLPPYFWKHWEGGKVDRYLKKCKTDKKEDEDDYVTGDVIIDLARLSRQLLARKGQHAMYGCGFVFSHLLGFIVIAVQLHLVDIFLDGLFVEYGLAVLGIKPMNVPGTNFITSNPMRYIFPRLTKCSMAYYSHIGQWQEMDGLCLLSLNIINEKIYVILWVLYMLLACWTLLSLIGHLLLKFLPEARAVIIWFKMPKGFRFQEVTWVTEQLCFSDWLLLLFTLEHFNSEAREALIIYLSRRLRRDVGDSDDSAVGSNNNSIRNGKCFEMNI